MRNEGIARLSGFEVNKNRQDYIVLHFLIRDLTDAIQLYAKGNLLDVGCGNKPYEALFKNRISSYIGCDVVQSDLNKVDVICEATSLTFPDAQFDTVFSTQVIEHVENPFNMLSEINRVLKPGGMLILSAPFSWELHEEPHDFFRYSKYGLQSMIGRFGFELVELRANGGKWAAISQLWLNMIYSSFKKKNLWIKFLKGIFINLHFTSLFNRLSIKIDKWFYDELLTLNYVLVARKK